MKSTVFELNTSNLPVNNSDYANPLQDVDIIVNGLDAYAIEYTVLELAGAGTQREGYDYQINENKLTWLASNAKVNLEKDDNIRLIVNYHGIRDYALLFPAVVEKTLKERLGKYYREAEINFENHCWLSYALMCGAIFEGLLFNAINSNLTFEKLIDNALNTGMIDLNASKVMHNTRECRNRVHASKHTKDYITQLEAMDIRTVMDKLIKKMS